MYNIFKALISEKIEPGNLGHIICTAAYDKFSPKTLMEVIAQIEKMMQEQNAHIVLYRPQIILSLTGSGVQRTIKGLKGGRGIRDAWNNEEGIIINGSYFDAIEYDMNHIKKEQLMEVDSGGYSLHAGIENQDKTLCGMRIIKAIKQYPALKHIENFEHHCLYYCSVCRDLVYNKSN
jgi:hypothetical protein